MSDLRTIWERLPLPRIKSGSEIQSLRLIISNKNLTKTVRANSDVCNGKPKPKYYLPAVSSRVNITRSQWEFKLKTNKLPKARENRSEHVAIDSSLASNWLREARIFLNNHRTKCSKTKATTDYLPCWSENYFRILELNWEEYSPVVGLTRLGWINGESLSAHLRKRLR